MSTARPTICLNMIVKNESKVITRCLDSIKGLIDYWVISDTGSTDGTQELITQYFQRHQISGILTEDEWQDFAHNRNIALNNAKGKADYILIMDADDYLVAPPEFHFPQLSADGYMLKLHRSTLDYYNTRLIRSSQPWRWESVLHEYMTCDTPHHVENLAGNYHIESTTEGARSQNPQKYQHDAAVLEKALLTEPDNHRYRFYLAQSYRDAGELEKAIENYQKRKEMGGWAEEAWFSLMEVARLKERLNYPQAEVTQAYLDAYEYRPQRAESLYHLANYLRHQDRIHLAYVYAQTATNTSLPNDILFVYHEVYSWRAKDELAIAAYWTGRYRECLELCDHLLSNPALPETERPRITDNLRYAQDKLEQG
ncbi:MAG: glycosyltransferase [Candidatus Thiothrix moscowensis]|nr:glycosyltransferase [Candidatus Thiothrix moscowensis]